MVTTSGQTVAAELTFRNITRNSRVVAVCNASNVHGFVIANVALAVFCKFYQPLSILTILESSNRGAGDKTWMNRG